MRSTFPASLQLVLAHEGGFVNHPSDPGGPTNQGITQAVYNSYRRNKGVEPRSVRHIERPEVEDIYLAQYWNAIKADQLPVGVDYAVFDYAVNSGPSRAIKDLQRTLGVGVDGVLGQMTLEAVKIACDNDEKTLLSDYCNRRMGFLKSLKTYGTFGKGWKRRVMGDRDGFQEGDRGVLDLATMMALRDLTYPMPKSVIPTAIGLKSGELNGKGLEQDQSKLKTKEGLGAAISASGITAQSVQSVASQVQPQIGDTLFGRLALALFILLSVVGAALFLWGFYQRYKEKSDRMNEAAEPSVS